MNGSRKKMLQLFRQSLVDPTGNSLAQAAWAEPLARVELLNGSGKISREYEACAHQAYSKGDFERALSHCENWIADEEYSSRPYQFGAATAGALDDYEASIRLTDKGLMLEPNSIGLRLSKIYALAIANRLQEAKKVIATFTNETDKYVCAILKADEGLIAFRSGDTQNGKALYLEALKNFKSLGNQESLRTACAYLAREAALAKDEEAEALFNAAMQINSSTSFSNLAIRVLNEAGLALGKPPDTLPQRLKPTSSSITWSTQSDSGVAKLQR
jgi:tetratricopeptide (TPR) repeat protein